MTRPISPESLHEAQYAAGDELADLIECERSPFARAFGAWADDDSFAMSAAKWRRMAELAALLKSDENSAPLAELLDLIQSTGGNT